MSDTASTRGIHHLGLTVPNLEATVTFFVDGLGWSVLGEDPGYPAVYIGDGTSILTLWSTLTDDPVAADRERNVGLHHLALQVDDLDTLHQTFDRVSAIEGVAVEFEPQQNPVGVGPRVHYMIYEPGGNRIEVLTDPK